MIKSAAQIKSIFPMTRKVGSRLKVKSENYLGEGKSIILPEMLKR